jgi:predicted NAD/FAD-binding protein
MRIAIIGGGAAGLVTAHLLDRAHEVTLYEEQAALGGHVRTLGLNVEAPRGLPCALDAGVIEFDSEFVPLVQRLFQRLDVAMKPVPATTTLFLKNGWRLLAPGAIGRGKLSWWESLWAWVAALAFGKARRHFMKSTDVGMEELYEQRFGDFLGASPYGRWLELLSMYAYSTPRERVADMPAALVVPMLRHFSHAESWFRVEGGVYTYMQRILDRLRGEIHTGVDVVAVERVSGGVVVELGDGSRTGFDALVFAVPPGEILPMLADASPDEQRRFGPWASRRIRTLVHCDEGIYQRRGASFATEFDLFELSGGRGGYNALLNLLCGVPDGDGRNYGLAFGLEDEIDPGTVMHVQEHLVPAFTLDSLRSREEIKASSGRRGIWYAGAWLGDGLHEGAVASALAVSRGLGGELL